LAIFERHISETVEDRTRTRVSLEFN